MSKQELKELIQATLSDGIISETELKVLIKKANALGIEEDELAILIDAEKNHQTNVVKNNLLAKILSKIDPKYHRFFWSGVVILTGGLVYTIYLHWLIFILVLFLTLIILSLLKSAIK